jgi:lysophospholipase L1-like esterase
MQEALANPPQNEREFAPRRRHPLLPRLILALVGIVLALLVVEGATRVRQYLKYGSARAQLFERVWDRRTGLWFPQPNFDNGRIKIDSRGFRNPEIQMPKPPGRIRLAFLGASTTFCTEVTNNEATWPSLVAKELQAKHPGVTFDYVNASVPGFDVELSRKNLETRVAWLQPDLILYYEATNDLSKDARRLAAEQGLDAGPSDDVSPLGRISTAWYLLEKNFLIGSRLGAARNGRKLVFDPDSLAIGFRGRLAEFLRAAQQVAPLTAVATFSHKARHDQPPDVQLKDSTTSLYYCPYMSVRGFLVGFDGYNRAIRAAAHETGVILIEGEDSIPGDDIHFADSVHFLDPGARLMADRVVRTLETSPEFNRLIQSRAQASGRPGAGT